jgi:hypothetical protein
VIKLQCPCSKQLEVPETLANQKIKCKGCGKILKVPPPPKLVEAKKVDESDPFLVKGFRACPGCAKNYPKDVKVCVDCGMDIDSGSMLYASLDGTVESAAPAAPKGFFPKLLAMLGLKGQRR